MVEQPETELLQELVRIANENRTTLVAIGDRISNIESEVRSMRLRMQGVEQQALAMTEQASGLHKRFDDVVERIERVEKRLERANVL